MNAKTMPGYTAEASLYRTSTRYRMSQTATQVDGGIRPAFCVCFPVCFTFHGIKFCTTQCHCVKDPIYDPYKLGPSPDPGYLATFDPDPQPWTPIPGLSTGGMIFGG